MTRYLNIRTIHAALAGLQVLTAGSSLADILGARTAGLIVLVIGAVQVAVASYQLSPQNTPARDVP